MPFDPEPVARGPSKWGLVLSVTSLLAGLVGSQLVDARVEPTHPESAVGSKVESTAGRVLTGILSLPFLVVAIGIGLAAVVVVVVRLRKNAPKALALSLVSLCLGASGIVVAILAFRKLIVA